MADIRFDPLLSPQEVERKLRGHRPFLKAGHYSGRVHRDGLELDLSKVEYADFGALALVLLLIEGALRRGIEAEVALPFDRARTGERQWLSSLSDTPPWYVHERAKLESRVRRRQEALSFMRRCGFVSALECRHVPNARKLLRVDLARDSRSTREMSGARPPRPSSVESTAPDRFGPKPRNIMPLQWVVVEPGKSRDSWDREALRLLTTKGVALSTSDAQAVARVVLGELLDNVADHATESEELACPPAALVGGVVTRRTRPDAVAAGDRDISIEHGRWLRSTGAPVVRLVVGDSGRGICNTLPFDDREAAPSRRTHSQEWKRNERIVLQAMSPWSTRRTLAHGSLDGVRGLASVRRVVGEASGSILFRSADVVAGYLYPPGGREPVGRPGLGWMPGTSVDIVLAPTAAPRALQSAAGEALDPTVSSVQQLPVDHAGRFDVTPTLSALRDVEGDDAVAVLVWEAPEDLDRRYAACMKLLGVAEELSDRAALVLLTPDRAATGLSAALREVDDIREREARAHRGERDEPEQGLAQAIREVDTMREERDERAPVPVLVLDERGELAWLGVSSQDRRLLSAVAGRPGFALHRSKVASIVARSPEAAEAILVRLKRWLVADGEYVRLRITPPGLVSAVCSHMRTIVGDAEFATRLRPDPGAVLMTPTLAAVDRWVDAGQIIARLGGPQLAGHLLGLQAARTLSGVAPEDLSVACIGRVPPAALDAFVAAVGARGRTFQLSGEVGLADDPGAPFVHADTALVCVTDLMVTANHVRHAIHDLVRAGARPQAVACFVDARAEEVTLPGQRTLPIMGLALPVHSSISLPLATEPNGRVAQTVEPVSVPSGFRPPPSPPATPIATEELLGWCREIDGALLTGHIARLARRHFYSLLDVLPLLGDAAIQGRIKQILARELDAWFRSLTDDPPNGIVLLRPGGANDRSAQFAALVHEAIDEWGAGLPVHETYAVERVARAGRNVLAVPQELLPSGTAVVVADWGAVTMHTTQELVHIAADMGAAAVLALILSSQLMPEDELAASHIRAVRGRQPDPFRRFGELPVAPPDSTTPAATSVPVSIRFLSSFPVGYANAAECAVCALAKGYVETAHHAPSSRLAEHALSLARILEPVELGRARPDGARDALGAHLRSHQAADVVALRQRLASAQLSTAARLELLDDLTAPSPELLDALVRELCLEPRWLKAAPLRFSALRGRLADALTARMRADRFDAAPGGLRRQYALVLRGTSKASFLDGFADLLVGALRRGDDAALANDLLLGVHTLLQRPYHDNPGSRASHSRALLRASAAIRQDPTLGGLEEGLHAREALSNMLAQLDYAAGLERDAGLKPRDAWLRLRYDFYDRIVGHDHDFKLAAVEGAVRIRSLQESQEWQAVVEEWERIQRFIADLVLPRLPAVADIVLHWFYDRMPSEDLAPRFRRLLSPDGLSDLAEFGSLLTVFAQSPRLALAKHQEVERQMDWWWDFFFRREYEGLLTVLAECPCDISEEFKAGLENGLGTTERPVATLDFDGPRDCNGFCHPRVVRGLAQQLLLNATQDKHAAPGAEGTAVHLQVRVTMTHEDVVVQMLNDGTQEGPVAGAGLQGFSEKLAHYGGSLTRVEDPETPWTFDVRASVPKW